jgi:hypothetical protein
VGERWHCLGPADVERAHVEHLLVPSMQPNACLRQCISLLLFAGLPSSICEEAVVAGGNLKRAHAVYFGSVLHSQPHCLNNGAVRCCLRPPSVRSETTQDVARSIHKRRDNPRSWLTIMQRSVATSERAFPSPTARNACPINEPGESSPRTCRESGLRRQSHGLTDEGRANRCVRAYLSFAWSTHDSEKGMSLRVHKC